MTSESPNVTACTPETCSLEEYGQIHYIPTLAGNASYLGIFALLFILQAGIGMCYKTWGYMAGMLGGLALEIVGYAGRIRLHYNIFDDDNFIIYLVGVTIGPALIAAAIYLCLGRIIVVYSVDLSMLKPKWITLIFIACDLISLVLQAAGGAITSTADDEDGNQLGIDIMIAGLASQVASLTIFTAICMHFAWKVFNSQGQLDPRFGRLRSSRHFKGMLFAITIAVTTILTRSIFRLIELQEGFDGKLANDELDFMVLEGPMIFIGVVLLTIWHPGWVLGSRLWSDAGFHLRRPKDRVGVKGVQDDGGCFEWEDRALEGAEGVDRLTSQIAS